MCGGQSEHEALGSLAGSGNVGTGKDDNMTKTMLNVMKDIADTPKPSSVVRKPKEPFSTAKCYNMIIFNCMSKQQIITCGWGNTGIVY
ncbi:hypothetical protein JOB18_048756 [Solea senegalensis]|uniref:Uncharacterized protein n=1 Tax=Solea senegalensis TaxID=28829 RepID=A0AAV6R5K2_SOLSE|nr:hypothetical protein JOB18_048756 [Solea senegalensis]